MQYKIIDESPWQILSNAMTIGPSSTGYQLQVAADGRNYTTLFTVGAGITRQITNLSSGSYFRMKGNEGEVTVNWVRDCSGGGGGAGGNAGELEPVTDFPVGAPAGTVVALSSGGTVGVYQYDGTEWASIGEGDMSNYYTKQETDTQIADAIADIPQPDMSNYYTKDEIGTKEEVVSRALNDLHEDILDLSGATPDLSNYYTKDETNAEISAATSPIQEQLSDVERVTASALTELHNDILDISGATPTNSPIIPAITSQAEYEAISGDVKTGDLIQVHYVDINGDGKSEYGLFGAHQVSEEESDGVVRKSIYWERRDNEDSVYWSDKDYPWMPQNSMNPIDFHNAFLIDYDATAEEPEVFNGIGFDDDGKPIITHFSPQYDETGEVTGITRADRAIVAGEGINRIMKLTQAEYDAITTPDASTLYIIINN